MEIQEIRERDLGNQVETEARQAVLDLASAQQQVTIADERLRLAEQELAQAQERFEAGGRGRWRPPTPRDRSPRRATP